MARRCYICRIVDAEVKRYSEKDAAYVKCEMCGEYSLTGSLKRVMEGNPLYLDSIERLKLCHYLYKNKNTRLMLDTSIKDKIKDWPIPTFEEQCDNFFNWISKELEFLDSTTAIYPFIKLAPIVGTHLKDEEGIKYILRYLFANSLIYINIPAFLDQDEEADGIEIGLTVEGWQHYKEMKKGAFSSRIAFMAMPFENPALEERYLKYKEAVKKTGFILECVTVNQPAGLIDDNIRVKITTSRFLLAELTGKNVNVYWEAGFAEGLGKPVIYICDKECFKDSKFDTNHRLTIMWDVNNENLSAKHLKDTIRATIPYEAKMTDDE